MPTLKDLVLTGDVRPVLIQDCVALVDREVASKSGLSGLAVKGAFSLVKAVKPGIIRDAVDRLIDAFVGQMETFYGDFLSAGGQGSFAAFLQARGSAVADALLGVTDGRIARADNPTIKKAYEKLRPSGKKHVEAAVPGIAAVVEKHLTT